MDEPNYFLEVNGVSYGISKLSNRKRMALVRNDDKSYCPVAYFIKDEDAEEFKEWLLGLFPNAPVKPRANMGD